MSLHEDRLRRVTRLFVIASLFQGGGRVTLDDLADACACSRRTITRDLLYLHEAGVPYRYDAVQRSYVLAWPLDLLTVQFSLPEILALAVAEGAVVGQEGTPFEAHIRSAFHEVTSLLLAALREEMAAALQTIVFQFGTKRDYGAVPWSELLAAIKTRETLEMDYYTLSRDELTTRRVDPYRLAWRNGYWNLVGYCHRRRRFWCSPWMASARCARPARRSPCLRTSRWKPTCGVRWDYCAGT